MRLLTILLVVGIGSITLSCEKCIKRSIQEDCICTQIYDPVCGCDGKTYSNGCVAQCAGVPDYEKGDCGK